MTTNVDNDLYYPSGNVCCIRFGCSGKKLGKSREQEFTTMSICHHKKEKDMMMISQGYLNKSSKQNSMIKIPAYAIYSSASYINNGYITYVCNMLALLLVAIHRVWFFTASKNF